MLCEYWNKFFCLKYLYLHKVVVATFKAYFFFLACLFIHDLFTLHVLQPSLCNPIQSQFYQSIFIHYFWLVVRVFLIIIIRTDFSVSSFTFNYYYFFSLESWVFSYKVCIDTNRNSWSQSVSLRNDYSSFIFLVIVFILFVCLYLYVSISLCICGHSIRIQANIWGLTSINLTQSNLINLKCL